MGTNTEAAQRPPWVRIILIGRKPKHTLIRIVVWVVTCFVVAKFVLLPIRVEGVSMLPSYKENRVNFVNRLAYIHSKPKRGDVVAIRLAGPSIMYMKRIVGLPGETVEFHEGQLYIDGHPLPEPYVKFYSNWEHPAETVGPDEYFVVGDNRSMGYYEHTKGRARRDRIMGKVLL